MRVLQLDDNQIEGDDTSLLLASLDQHALKVEVLSLNWNRLAPVDAGVWKALATNFSMTDFTCGPLDIPAISGIWKAYSVFERMIEFETCPERKPRTV